MTVSYHAPLAWLKNFALLVASFLCGLLLIEFALRLMGWSFPIIMQPDLDLGWSHRPGMIGWSSSPENTAYLRMNRFGFRGPDWPQRHALSPIAAHWALKQRNVSPKCARRIQARTSAHEHDFIVAFVIVEAARRNPE
jgi:hypothetical protein